jgi:hypothetical protein
MKTPLKSSIGTTPRLRHYKMAGPESQFLQTRHLAEAKEAYQIEREESAIRLSLFTGAKRLIR